MKAILGAHSLSDTLTIDDPKRLQRLMKMAVEEGARMFEFPYLTCRIPLEHVAELGLEVGIEEMALCHFWPMGPKPQKGKQKSVCGNPLATGDEYEKCFRTLDTLLEGVATLRRSGMEVRFVDGPTAICLGHFYRGLSATELHKRVVKFLKRSGKIFADHGIIQAVEQLRFNPEDRVIHSTKAMVRILQDVALSSVKEHFDAFHAFENGEDPMESIVDARHWIAYLHVHGEKRRAPGSRGDHHDWGRIMNAVKLIESGVDPIPVLPEPFGEDTCNENSNLGQDVEIPTNLRQYLSLTYRTYRASGLPIASH